ncbi:polyprenol phosphomannose-dependent alpha 1,6 mannosyltransferase MptB [Rothia nasimurium]|uniref:polyprenol phosphomannose-dependent alpha 1,6 mannosyltransferase MptB n=1 Tax=Rothia nasimurium TaxID=85336 RepID=UPI001F212443|nr:polyprenol phosphomannose-dependent alpha 1,6 mannosyltransferase MptB [Rothia nasimurium]
MSPRTAQTHTDSIPVHRYNPKTAHYISGSPLRTLIFGTIGSVLVMFASFGVGWLADASPFRRVDWIIPLRYTAPGLITCIALLVVGSMMLCREWLRMVQKLLVWDQRAKRWATAATICWMLPQLFAFPLYSRDVFSYFAQGRVMASGLNPYEYGVSSVNNFFQYGADQMWSESAPPYGPIFLLIEKWVAQIAGDSVDTALYLFRLVALIGVGLIAYYVPKLAKLHGINGIRANWLVLANPLFIAAFITSSHNDALMTGLVLAGVYHAAARRDTMGGLLGITLVTAAVAVKPIALVALPFIGLFWAGRGASWPRRFMFWAMTLAISMAELWVLGAVTDLGFGWIGALATTGGQYIWFTPIGFLGLQINQILVSITGDNALANAVRDTFFSLGKLAGMLLAVVVMFVGKDENLIRRTGLALAMVVVFSPMLQSWYLLWFIPLFVVAGVRTDWQLDFYFLTTLFFVMYGVSDQLAVSPYLDNFDQNMGRLIAAVLSVAYAFWLVFFDPATRRVLRRGQRSSLYEVSI